MASVTETKNKEKKPDEQPEEVPVPVPAPEKMAPAPEKIVQLNSWKNPTAQKIEVSVDHKAVVFLPGEVKNFEDINVTFGKNTRLIKS